MTCQILFSGKNKKTIINLSSAGSAQRMVKVQASFIFVADDILKFFRENRFDISGESFSVVILSFQLIQEGQLSVYGKRL